METLVKTTVKKTANSRESALWTNYTATCNIGVRNELVLLYINLVEIIVRKMTHVFSGKAQMEDIISNGTIALIKAVESFDPTRGVLFETYASRRIKGSVIDYIREQDWIPRTSREKAKKTEDTIIRLKEQFGRDPTYREVSEELGIKEKDVEAVLAETHTYHVFSLDELLTDRMDTNYEIEDNYNLTPPSLLLKKELRNILCEAIDSLSDKERLVTTLFYYEGLKVKEIAEVMGISAPRVCQLHSMSLIKMKAKVREYIGL